MKAKEMVRVFSYAAMAFSISTFGLVSSGTAMENVKPGDDAPAFTGKDSNGKKVSLSDFKGKYVVLEWHNEGCPFVKKHYKSGNMQKLQSTWTGKGVAWLSVISSAKGKEGAVDGKGANADVKRNNSKPTATILDLDGKIGRLYGAKTTPHMFVINPDGKIIYNGAIDDQADAKPESVNGAKNYVSQALDESMSGKPVSHPVETPYGCSVKYGS